MLLVCSSLLFGSSLVFASAQIGAAGVGTQGTAATTASGYNCPSSCVAPACVCASKEIPGGLPKEKTPQFVTLTFDDAIQPYSYPVLNALLESAKNANGCRLPATHFISTQYSEFPYVHGMFYKGDEIAAHTVNHANMAQSNAATIAAEINGCKDILTTIGGVPRNKLLGFRHPFLSFSKASFDTLFQGPFLYDSSVTLDPINQGYWPHTLDYGMPYNPQPCTDCPPGESFRYPGKWEIPMYPILKPDNTVYTTMDPNILPNVDSTFDDAMTALKHTFRIHYEKKLPFGLYQHAAQLPGGPWGPDAEAKKLKLFKDFFEWTMTEFKDVWYVTNQQLIEWIKKPVPVDKMLSFLPCIPPPTDSLNAEVCDGVDNNGNGSVDEGLTETCSYGTTSFTSCYGCPVRLPSISEPVPPRSGSRKLVPDNGCNTNEVWDPIEGNCVVMARPKIAARAGTAGSSSTNGDKSDADGGSSKVNFAYKTAISAVVSALVFMIAGI